MSTFARFLNFALEPFLRWLGYRKATIESALPESRYYMSRHGLGDLVSVHHGFLRSSGWLESVNANLSFFQGEHKPWTTFPAIHFLETMPLAESNVLEFGGGASTIYFSKRARNVRTLEFDTDWSKYLRIATKDLINCEIISPSIDSALLKAWAQSEQENLDFEVLTDVDFELDAFVVLIKQMFYEADVVLIDGGPRNIAMIAASKFAKSSAVVIVDNSERDGLRSGIYALRREGFVEIPMKGLGPLNHSEWITSFFIRDLTALKSNN